MAGVGVILPSLNPNALLLLPPTVPALSSAVYELPFRLVPSPSTSRLPKRDAAVGLAVLLRRLAMDQARTEGVWLAGVWLRSLRWE